MLHKKALNETLSEYDEASPRFFFRSPPLLLLSPSSNVCKTDRSGEDIMLSKSPSVPRRYRCADNAS